VGSHFGKVTTQGLDLKPAEEYGYGTQMRHFQGEESAKPGWSVDWKIEDRYSLLPAGSDIHFRYTDLTSGAQACIAEGWVVLSISSNEEVWIPRVMVRRQAKDGPLASTFVSVMEPYEKAPNLAEIRRLGLETPEGEAYPEGNVAVEVRLADGRRDLWVAMDAENPSGLKPSLKENKVAAQKEWKLGLEGEMGWIRRNREGKVSQVSLCRARWLRAGDVEVRLKQETGYIEIELDGGKAAVASGKAEDVEDILLDGKSIWHNGG